jgi:hypothetical protein
MQAAKKARHDEIVNADDVKHINDNCAQLNEELASLGAYTVELEERLRRVEGMAKFCYAICNNPAIKDLADAAPAPARRWGGGATQRVYGGGQSGAARSVFVPSPGGYVAPKRDSN